MPTLPTPAAAKPQTITTGDNKYTYTLDQTSGQYKLAGAGGGAANPTQPQIGTPEYLQQYGGVQAPQTQGNTGSPFGNYFSSIGLNVSPTMDSSQLTGQPMSGFDINSLLQQNAQLRKSYMDSLAPSQNTLDLTKSLDDLLNQSRDVQLNAAAGIQGVNEKPIALEFQTGQKQNIENRANLQLQTLGAQQAPMLQRLGLSQQADKSKTDALQAGLQFAGQDINFAMQANQMLQQQQQFILGRMDKLNDSARQSLATVLDKFQGLTFDSLDEGTQKSLAGIASQVGIPLDVLVKGMDVVAGQIEFDNMIKAGNLSLSQQRLANTIGNGGTAPNIQGLAESVLNGKIAPSQLPGMGVNSLRGKVFGEISKSHPDFDFQKAESDYIAKQAYTRYINSPTFQNVIKYLDSLLGTQASNGQKTSQGNLDEVVLLSDKFKRSFFMPVNKGYIWGLANSGNTDAVRYQTAVVEVADQVAKILQGGGTGSGTSDAKLKQAQDLLNTNFSAAQFKAVASELQTLLNNRRNALTNDTMQTIGTQVKSELDQQSIQGEMQQYFYDSSAAGGGLSQFEE